MKMRHFLIGLNLIAPVAAIFLWVGGYFWIGLGLLFVAHMLALIATLVPGCQWWGSVMTRFDTDEKEVWLTIDDGPDPDDTPAILALLDEYDAKATFFVIGEKAKRWPELVAAIEEAGHEVENHTMSHPQFAFWRFGPGSIKSEISGNQELLSGMLANPPRLFRAPAGMRNLFVHPILRTLGLRLVGWSSRGRDGVSTDREAIVRLLTAGIQQGAILLMHEGKRDPEGRSLIVDTLPQVLESIRAQGYGARLPVSVD